MREDYLKLLEIVNPLPVFNDKTVAEYYKFPMTQMLLNFCEDNQIQMNRKTILIKMAYPEKRFDMELEILIVDFMNTLAKIKFQKKYQPLHVEHLRLYRKGLKIPPIPSYFKDVLKLPVFNN